MSDSTPLDPKKARHRRRRFAPAALIAGAVATAAVALSMTGTLAGFTAQIANNANSASTGTLTMQESGPNSAGTTVTCNSTDANPAANNINTNAATCSTINKYGGSAVMVPGQTVTTSVTIKNTGTVPANTFTLKAGACSQAANGTVNGTANDLCAKMSVVVTQTAPANATPVVPSSTLTAFGAAAATSLTAPVAPGASVTFAFAVTLSSTADNTYQGLTANQTLTWQFTS